MYIILLGLIDSEVAIDCILLTVVVILLTCHWQLLARPLLHRCNKLEMISAHTKFRYGHARPDECYDT